jgi:hypothetical protein
VPDCVFSPDRRYRYRLEYRWNHGPICGWILLNPSRSEPICGDLTLSAQKCVNYAWKWGYGGIVIRNRFAYRATYPRDLLTVADPYGPENEAALASISEEVTVAAWGSAKALALAPPLPPGVGPLYCIGVNRDGEPRHPLHASGRAELRRYEPERQEAR